MHNFLDEIGDCRDNEVDISLITGKIRSTNIQEESENQNNTKQIMQYSKGLNKNFLI